ncbi:MAG: replication-associated recombination protein A, partial [Streptococcus thermophilus]|nr:replication-associated recombination protein A [Streptococcus thermophilus]
DYKYPHAYPEKWVKQQYLPDKLRGVNYFQPNETGKYERALGANKERIDKLSR